MTGPVICDVEGLRLNQDDRRRIAHPQCGGIILFSRNYESPDQLKSLTAEIRQASPSPRLITVDHEGGRVQRFREGFNAIPSMASLGRLYLDDPAQALNLAECFGWLMAAELRFYDIDLSFAPVLDIGNPISDVIGNRAFAEDPEIIIELAKRWIAGMNSAGMAAVGKHFPGHGSVVGDSHHMMPVDPRPFDDIDQLDLKPFSALMQQNLQGLMMAHVVYPEVDSLAAGFSEKWIKHFIRQKFQYDGVVFSDDLCMRGAESVGDMSARTELAIKAGCDVLLVCNNPDASDDVLAAAELYTIDLKLERINSLFPPVGASFSDLFEQDNWTHRTRLLAEFNQSKYCQESTFAGAAL